jgi:purine-binding chemotaxis protein CheW
MTTTIEMDAVGTADTLQSASFDLGDALMAIPIQQIEEINRHLALTPVPHAPPFVRGVINLRGEVMTVIDLRAVLGLGLTEITPQTRNVIVTSKGEHIGLLVDRIAEVVATERDQIEPPPANVSGVDGRFFRGVQKLEGELLVILDVETVMTGSYATA